MLFSDVVDEGSIEKIYSRSRFEWIFIHAIKKKEKKKSETELFIVEVIGLFSRMIDIKECKV